MKTLIIVGFWLSWLLVGCAHASGIARTDQMRGPPTVPTALAPLGHASFGSAALDQARLDRADYQTVDGQDYLSPDADGQGWWRVQPAPFSGERVLAIYHPYSAHLTVWAPPDYRPQAVSIFDTGTTSALSRRALLFDLQQDGPVYVGVSGARYPLHVSVESAEAYDIIDYSHVRVLWSSMGVLLGVSLVALLFWLRLRDRVYLMFAASMLMQSLYVLCAYGDAYTLPGLRWLARFGV